MRLSSGQGAFLLYQFDRRDVLRYTQVDRVSAYRRAFGYGGSRLPPGSTPDVSFIVAHLGSFADDWRAHLRVVEQLERYPNVFADSSGVRRFDYLVSAVRRAGPEKLLFGSDGPWLHPGLELQKIKLLGLSPAAEALVLGRNFERLVLSPRA